MTFEYCPKCGAQLVLKEIGDEGPVPFCSACDKPFFNFSYPCVICLIIDESNHFALIKQSYVSDHYICVAGFVKQGETPEQTAKREVEEETGLAVLSVQYINSYYYQKRDNLMLGFVCRVKKSAFQISKEVDSAKWFSLAQTKDLLRKGSVGKDLLQDYLESIQ